MARVGCLCAQPRQCGRAATTILRRRSSTGTSPAKWSAIDISQDKARQLGITSAERGAGSQHGDQRQDHHAGARQHLSRRRRRPGRKRPAHLIETLQNLQVQAASGRWCRCLVRQHPLRPRTADRLAAGPRADDHRSATIPMRPSRRRKEAARARQSRVQREVPAEFKLARAARSRGAARGRRRGDASRSCCSTIGDLHHGPAPELRQAAAGPKRGAARAHRRGRRAAADRQPLGFVAILGVLALIGIIIRNAMILMARSTTFWPASTPGLPWSRRRSTACGRSC